jgi:hypothetical protein
MGGRLDIVERERSGPDSGASGHVGWKKDDSWYSFTVLKTFLRVSKTETRP